MTEHEGLPVQGYKPQSQDNVDLVNANKALEERCLRAFEKIEGTGRADGRALAIARTKLQEGFMWANRAVFQPERVELPADETNV